MSVILIFIPVKQLNWLHSRGQYPKIQRSSERGKMPVNQRKRIQNIKKYLEHRLSSSNLIHFTNGMIEAQDFRIPLVSRYPRIGIPGQRRPDPKLVGMYLLKILISGNR